MIGTAMAVTSVAQGLFSFGASKSARKKMRKARKAAMLEHDRATRYNVGQMEKESVAKIGGINAQIGASNLQFTGTPVAYRSAVQQQLDAELTNFKMNAAAERANIRATGSMQMDAVKNQGTSALLGAAGKALSYGAGAFSSPSNAQVDAELGAEQWDF
jgi:hypothetical protein